MSDAVQPSHLGSPPPQVPPAEAPGKPVLTGVVVAVAVVAALYFGSEVLIPITVALLLSFLLSPLVELLRRVWLGRILSVVLAVILALGVIIALGSAIGTQMAQLTKDIPQYQTTIVNKVTSLRDATIKRLSSKIEDLGHQLAGSKPSQRAVSAPASTDTGPSVQPKEPVPVVVTQPAPSALQVGEKVLSPLLHPVATAGIILVVTIFTLLQKEDLRDRAIRLFGSSDLHRTTIAMNDAGRRLSRYFLTQLGINTSFGVIVGIGVYFIGIPNPVLWGILGTLLRFIPYIGSWIAAALPIALAAAVAPGWSMVIWTTVLYVATELTMGQLVEPMIYGHSTGLSPLAVIIAAIFWTWVWGPIGLIISTPITLCLVVLGRHVENLEFFDVLLGDRPPLSPVESFYQRMLARDPDEAEEQAERYLADRPLSSYYDEVVLKALQLAANDVVRGTLTPLQLERLKTSTNELVQDLDKYDDVPPAAGEAKQSIAGPTADQQALPKQPPPTGDLLDNSRLALEWRSKAPVLCIAGRGPLDEAASGMLAQLLGKHGLGAQTVSYDAVSRSNIGALNFREIAMICISYLDIGGNPAHLRYLLRRLRERLPKALLLVGLWPAQDPILHDQDLRQAIGADYYVSTLHEAVEACLAAAKQAARAKPRLVTAGEEAGSH
ncbi:MAG: AI-2E family transporter [Acidobacteria bacterium]|nr:AI-2E family transporter [Acidobacteriota bacterium]MBV9480905.1 AI-2E family transporter [Acidobacteriota bacterium]